MSLDSLKY